MDSEGLASEGLDSEGLDSEGLVDISEENSAGESVAKDVSVHESGSDDFAYQGKWLYHNCPQQAQTSGYDVSFSVLRALSNTD